MYSKHFMNRDSWPATPIAIYVFDLFRPHPTKVVDVCVFITAGPSTKLFAWGGGGYWRTCATRDDEPRLVWTSLPITH